MNVLLLRGACFGEWLKRLVILISVIRISCVLVTPLISLVLDNPVNFFVRLGLCGVFRKS